MANDQKQASDPLDGSRAPVWMWMLLPFGLVVGMTIGALMGSIGAGIAIGAGIGGAFIAAAYAYLDGESER